MTHKSDEPVSNCTDTGCGGFPNVSCIEYSPKSMSLVKGAEMGSASSTMAFSETRPVFRSKSKETTPGILAAAMESNDKNRILDFMGMWRKKRMAKC
jgi:hypothetical protein